MDRPAHRDGSPGHPRVKSTSSSVPSSVAQAIRAAHLPDESLHQTWKFFESILDKKLDGFRESVASVQNSPPSQTWSPDAKAILASTIREAIRDEMPRSRFDSATTNDTDATKEQALLVAIQQTQNMINALTRHHDDPGLETASPSGEWKESSVQSAQNARSDNDAFIEQLAERLAQRTGKLDIKYIVEKLSQVYHNSLQEAIAKM